ncbi:Adenylyl-sulfate kinase (APS kinase) [Cymbomonas tetramitiformis]|uniref:Adenylyl-sulfate kinase (APS kinase) n=1 Tax=Cymbomonas tetramitiformis TaxID=36881 RepID=A0AAE0BMH3_9CHLO|nr:Adenylyl-sulfate kinase (APS kinase) [Cymbomonas tetramitiformis]|eukprot:gene9711-11510_t
MDLDSARYKKKVRPGVIELAPDDCAIIVNYEVEATVQADNGEEMVVERKPSEKKIKVKTLTANSNLQILAQEIVEKCKLIHNSKVGMIQQLLRRLQQRELNLEDNEEHEHSADQKLLRQRLEAERYQEEQRRIRQAEDQEREFQESIPGYTTAVIEDLDDYLEKLYEEVDEKVTAAHMISQLARRTENLEVLLMSENLLSALARVLREDGRKSIDLAINLVSVFFSFSHFSQFHQVILEHQIGDMTMRLVDLELKRADEREKAEKEAGKKESSKKTSMMTRKQDKLVYYCLYLLLNLAEDVAIERKMKKRNIVLYLVSVLDRKNVELLILAVTFLKKLSIYKENKDKMQSCGIIQKLAKFVPVGNDVLQNATLRLLLNLSFDASMRDDMVQNGLIQKVVELMKNPLFQNVSMALLYHISMDDKCKSMFTYTGIIPWILENLLQIDDLHTAPELISLAVNLTQNARNAEVMCEGNNLLRLLSRGMETLDPLLFKVVRNLSQQETQLKLKFKPFMEGLVSLLKSPETSNELLVEVLGTLGNLNIPEFDYYYLVREHGLTDFLSAHLDPGEVEDDIVLEVVIFIGTLCNEPIAPLIVHAGLVEKLFQLMSDKKEDDEMVLQISFTFHRLLLYEPTREALLRHTQVVFYLVDLLQDKNKEVRKIADAALDVIIDTDEEWAIKIRRMKFESHNQDWLAVCEQSDMAEFAAEHMYMPEDHMQAQYNAMQYSGMGLEDGGSDDEVDFGHYARQSYDPDQTAYGPGDDDDEINVGQYAAAAARMSYDFEGEDGQQFWTDEDASLAHQTHDYYRDHMAEGAYEASYGAYGEEHYL